MESRKVTESDQKRMDIMIRLILPSRLEGSPLHVRSSSIWGFILFLIYSSCLYFSLDIFLYNSNVIPFPASQNNPPILFPSPSIKVFPSPTIPLPPPRHSPILGDPALAGPRTSLSTGAQQVHPLLHMQLE